MILNLEIWIVYVCHSEGDWARQNIAVFEWGMVLGDRRTGLGVSRTATLLGFSTVSFVYQEWSTTQRTSSQLHTTVGSIRVNICQHPCGTLETL